jgi:NADH-quinone oxidoreductase subunit A
MMPETVGYLLMFTGIGVAFVLVNLTVGWFLRPSKMDAEKGTIYECGEPSVGSAWVQFDLRFYVVALLFVIFDVEMAFFFPWAVVFGQANQLADPRLPAEARADKTLNFYVAPVHTTDPNWAKDPETFRKLLTIDPAKASDEEIAQLVPTTIRGTPEANRDRVQKAKADALANNIATAKELGWLAFADILVFFGVLLVGFAYLWKRGDLNWVRSLASQKVEEEALARDRQRELPILSER